jgi:hypothetical protein
MDFIVEAIDNNVRQIFSGQIHFCFCQNCGQRCEGLCWCSSSFHKVQGMQFPKIRVDFCLDGSNPKQQSTRLFYQSMAYMGLSRSNCVTIQGNITLELLNNVKPIELEYWLQKLDNQKLRKPVFYVYKNAIHAKNDFCAQKSKEARNLTLAKALRLRLLPLLLTLQTFSSMMSQSLTSARLMLCWRYHHTAPSVV